MRATDVYQQHYDADREVNKFLHQYEATAGLGHKRYARRLPVSYRKWMEEGGPIPFHQEVEVEQMVEMHIPKHQFQRLVERDSEMEDLVRGREWENQIIQNLRNEERIRDSNPSVKLAWERYAMLLELARK